ncbi:MAG: GlxA family transcriptional regulator [Caulobacterales bacterium]
MTGHIVFLVYPDFQILDAAGPIAAFEIAARFSPGTYRFSVVAAEGGEVASSAGVAMTAAELPDPGGIDTLVVVGGAGCEPAARDAATLDFVKRTAMTARRIASVCSGAFVLAATGLLDGRRATTHWSRTDDFTRRFPRVRLDPDRIWVKDGHVWTSAGITAGIDLSLALIEEDLGLAVAKAVARQLVVYHRRPGGQSQFSALLELDRPQNRFASVLAWARERLHEPLSVERLADRAAMSPRHFARAFAAETGVTPAKAVERLRLEVARSRVEAADAHLDAVALETGFGDPERMRRAFIRAFGQPPQALRRAARSEREAA